MDSRSISLFLAAFAGACSVQAVEAVQVQAVHAVHPVDLVAHRGASHDAPENTLTAEKLAWRQDADAVETDIHLTGDGKIIVSHDNTTGRTAGRQAAIASLKLSELRELDAGKWKGPQFAGEKLPTLDEQIALIPAGRRLLIDIKIGPAIVPELERCLAQTGASEENITIISANLDSLKEVRKSLPRYPTLYLVDYGGPDEEVLSDEMKKELDEVIAEAQAAKLTGLDLEHTWPLDAVAVKKIKAAGLELHVWTVDDVAIAKHWIDLGVSSITTNRPAWLRQQLE